MFARKRHLAVEGEIVAHENTRAYAHARRNRFVVGITEAENTAIRLAFPPWNFKSKESEHPLAVVGERKTLFLDFHSFNRKLFLNSYEKRLVWQRDVGGRGLGRGNGEDFFACFQLTAAMEHEAVHWRPPWISGLGCNCILSFVCRPPAKAGRLD